MSFIKYSIQVFFSLILITLLNIANVNSEIYKWIDKNGKIHFSDKSIDKNAKKIKEKKKLPEAYLNESRQQTKKLISFQNRIEQNRKEEARSEKVEKLKKQKKDKNLKAACARIAKDIRMMGNVRPTYYENNKKENVYLSDDDKNQSIEEGKVFIRNNCNFD